MEDLLVETARPDVRSLALGLPAPDLFPTETLGRSLERTLDRDPRALQYEPPREELRAFVADRMRTRGVRCDPEDVFLTAGAQQGMSFATRLVLDPGDVVVVEETCYPGFLQAAAPQEPRLVTLSSDLETGLDVDALEARLGEGLRPKLLYVIPDGHNPRGVSLPLTTRERLVALSQKYAFVILEDDAYGAIDLGNDPLPCLRALDPSVVHAGSFSKTLAPALRAGWLIAPRSWRRLLGSLKESSDINTSTLAHRAIQDFAGSGEWGAHVDRLRRGYRQRRDAMLDAVRRHFPSGSRHSRPQAGFFVWVDLPGETDTVALLRSCLDRERVAFLPGAAFAAGGAFPSRSGLRLSYSFLAPDEIEDAVSRIGRVLADWAPGVPHG